jgi:hypothetical protein
LVQAAREAVPVHNGLPVDLVPAATELA